jgi:transposase
MKKPNIKETIEELNIMLHKERNAELKMRIQMLVLLKNGECRKRKEIADRLAVHRNTIRNWLSIYMSNGLSQLLKIKPRGPASGQKTLDNSILSSLKERLEDTSLFAMDLKPNSRFPERAILKKNESDVTAFKEGFSEQVKSIKETTKSENP